MIFSGRTLIIFIMIESVDGLLWQTYFQHSISAICSHLFAFANVKIFTNRSNRFNQTFFYSQPFKFEMKYLYRCSKRNGIYHKATICDKQLVQRIQVLTRVVTHLSFISFFQNDLLQLFCCALSLKYEKYCHKYKNKLKWFDESTSKSSLEMASLLNDLTDFDLTAYRFELCYW